MPLARYSVLVWFLVRLARFGFAMVDNHLSCPIVCMVWSCPICSLGFGLIPHAASSLRGAFTTSVPRRSGMACPVDLPVVLAIEASYVITSWVVGACNTGLQGLEWGCCYKWDRWHFLCWSLTNSSRAFSFVFASVWTTNTHSRRFSKLSGSGSDLQ